MHLKQSEHLCPFFVIEFNESPPPPPAYQFFASATLPAEEMTQLRGMVVSNRTENNESVYFDDDT